MATKIENLFNANGEMMYPLTHTKAVVNDSGENVEQILEAGLELANQGYKFMGIATPTLVPITQPTPGSPKVYWEASIAGTYGNLGNLVVNDGETAYLMWNGATWEKKISNTIVNDLTTGGADKALSAEMGKKLTKMAGLPVCREALVAGGLYMGGAATNLTNTTFSTKHQRIVGNNVYVYATDPYVKFRVTFFNKEGKYISDSGSYSDAPKHKVPEGAYTYRVSYQYSNVLVSDSGFDKSIVKPFSLFHRTELLQQVTNLDGRWCTISINNSNKTLSFDGQILFQYSPDNYEWLENIPSVSFSGLSSHEGTYRLLLLYNVLDGEVKIDYYYNLSSYDVILAYLELDAVGLVKKPRGYAKSLTFIIDGEKYVEENSLELIDSRIYTYEDMPNILPTAMFERGTIYQGSNDTSNTAWRYKSYLKINEDIIKVKVTSPEFKTIRVLFYDSNLNYLSQTEYIHFSYIASPENAVFARICINNPDKGTTSIANVGDFGIRTNLEEINDWYALNLSYFMTGGEYRGSLDTNSKSRIGMPINLSANNISVKCDIRDRNVDVLRFFKKKRSDGTFWRIRVSFLDSKSKWIQADESYTDNVDFIIPSNACYVRVGLYLWKDDKAAVDNTIAPEDYLSNEEIYTNINLMDDSKKILKFEEAKDSFLTSMKSKKYGDFCIAHISDTHGERAISQLQSFIEVINTYHVTSAIITGDFVLNTFEDTFNYYAESVDKSRIPIMLAIGNHEIGNSAYPDKVGTDEQVFEKYINPFYSQWGCVLGGDKKSYYYKDYTEGYRIIVLNQFEAPLIKTETGSLLYPKDYAWYSQEQLLWLINTLQSTPSNMSVILAMHMPEAVIEGDTNFYSPYPVTFANMKNVQGNPVADIIDAYMNKKDINMSYSGCGTTVSVVADFSNSGGEFVCYLMGHHHRDLIGYYKDYPNQLCLCIDCDNAHNFSSSDIPKVLGKKSANSINVIGFDKTLKVVKVVRIGGDFSTAGQHRVYHTYKYAH